MYPPRSNGKNSNDEFLAIGRYLRTKLHHTTHNGVEGFSRTSHPPPTGVLEMSRIPFVVTLTPPTSGADVEIPCALPKLAIYLQKLGLRVAVIAHPAIGLSMHSSVVRSRYGDFL